MTDSKKIITFTLRMEVTRFSKMLVSYCNSTQHHNPVRPQL